MGDENNINDEKNDFLTLDYIKNYLRVDYNDDDEFLLNCLEMALLHAKNIIGKRFDDVKNNADVKQAIMYHIAQIYQNKAGENTLPQASSEIYKLYRDIKIGI